MFCRPPFFHSDNWTWFICILIDKVRREELKSEEPTIPTFDTLLAFQIRPFFWEKRNLNSSLGTHFQRCNYFFSAWTLSPTNISINAFEWKLNLLWGFIARKTKKLTLWCVTNKNNFLGPSILIRRCSIIGYHEESKSWSTMYGKILTIMIDHTNPCQV